MSDETDQLATDYRELGVRLDALGIDRQELAQATKDFVAKRAGCVRLLHDLKARLNRSHP